MYELIIYLIDDVLMVEPLRPFVVSLMVILITISVSRVLSGGDEPDLAEDDD